MNSTLSFLLLLSLVLLASGKRSPSFPDQYSHALDKIMTPYRNIYDASVKNANTHLEQFKKLIQWQSADKNASDATPEPLKLKAVDTANDEDLGDESNYDILNDAHNRVLADKNPCSHNGILTDTKVNIFTCANKTVTESQYEARGGEGCQARYNVTRKMCFCSYEFYGDLCEKFNPWICQLDRLNYPDTCTGADSFDYVYAIDGVPPCYQVADGETITINTALVCRSSDTTYNYEGVKPSRYQVVQQPDLGPNVFDYVIEGDQVKLTFEPTGFQQEITFSNWNLMSEPYVIETNLSSSQIVGNSTINTGVSFTAPLINFASFGRYYYEIIIRVGNMDGLNPILTSNYYYGGYFEKAGYREPSAPNKVNVPLAIGLSILGALLLIGVFFGYRRFRNKKKMVVYRERANSIFADDRQD